MADQENFAKAYRYMIMATVQSYFEKDRRLDQNRYKADRFAVDLLCSEP